MELRLMRGPELAFEEYQFQVSFACSWAGFNTKPVCNQSIVRLSSAAAKWSKSFRVFLKYRMESFDLIIRDAKWTPNQNDRASRNLFKCFRSFVCVLGTWGSCPSGFLSTRTIWWRSNKRTCSRPTLSAFKCNENKWYIYMPIDFSTFKTTRMDKHPPFNSKKGMA